MQIISNILIRKYFVPFSICSSFRSLHIGRIQPSLAKLGQRSLTYRTPFFNKKDKCAKYKKYLKDRYIRIHVVNKGKTIVGMKLPKKKKPSRPKYIPYFRPKWSRRMVIQISGNKNKKKVNAKHFSFKVD